MEITGTTDHIEDPARSKTRFLANEWGTRHTMTLLGFFGFAILYSMRFNLSIAIVDIVSSSKKIRISNVSSSDNSLNHNSYQELCPNSNFLNDSSKKEFSQNTTATFQEDVHGGHHESAMLSWTEEEQGLIMGSFFWGYVVTQYPGGYLAHKHGAKWVISSGLLITGILALVTPAVTMTWGKYGLITIRILQGLGEGVTYPAMHAMLAEWSPPEERSRLATLVFTGMAIGTGMTMVTGGYLIHYFGWPSLFYSIGIITIIWFCFWSILVHSRPSEHPRISQEELNYIETAIGGEALSENTPTPWKDIIRSVPVLTVLINHIGFAWGHYFLHTEVPKYLHSVQHFKIQHTGWLSALPQFLNALWCSAAAFLGVIFGGCDTIVSVTFLIIGGSVMGASHGGWVVNNIDIAPNHAGKIMGVCNAVSNSLGFVAPYVTGLILSSDGTLHGWRIAFLIPAVSNFTVNIIFLIFSSAKEQPWNRPRPIVP